MSDVRLGKTGIISSKNGFGALPIQRVSDEYAIMLLQKAYNNGFTFFDTARMYTDSERKIGIALSSFRANITLATKTTATNVEVFWKDLETSLSLLKTDYIDIYQFHNPSFCPKPDDGTGLYEAMLEAKSKGLIKHIGITNHRPWVAEEAVVSGLYETLQFPFCYLATETDLKLVSLCKEHDVGFIAMKGLSGGLINDSAVAFYWMTKYSNVLPIWGIQRENELNEFIYYSKHGVIDTEMAESVIKKDREELKGSFCRACGYCMPCPMDIEINTCARMSQLIRRSPSENWLTPKSREMMKKVESCIECGQCSSKCPYGLNTPLLLKQNLKDYLNIVDGNTKI